jgi:hypothetical protein
LYLAWQSCCVRGLGFAAASAAAGIGYRLLVGGELTIDTGWGRTIRALGPFSVDVAAPREVVFDVIAEPYLGRMPRAMAGKLEVIERGSDMVLAAHRTPVRRGLVATTLETVRFRRPTRVDFRLVRGPIPHVIEHFVLHLHPGGTRLEYGGEMGADLWAVGRWWGERVARKWEAVVRSSFTGIKVEAERRTNSSGSGVS